MRPGAAVFLAAFGLLVSSRVFAAEPARASVHFDLGPGFGTLGGGILATLGVSRPAGAWGHWVLEGGVGPRPAPPDDIYVTFIPSGGGAGVVPSPVWFGLTGPEWRGAPKGGSVAFARVEIGAAVAHGGVPVPGAHGLADDPASGRSVVSPAVSIAAGFRGAPGLGLSPLVTARVLGFPDFAEHALLGSLGFGVGW